MFYWADFYKSEFWKKSEFLNLLLCIVTETKWCQMMAFSFLITPGVIDSQTFQDHNPHTREVNQRAGLILFKITGFFFFYQANFKKSEYRKKQALYFTEATKTIASIPLGHCLGALGALQ